MSAILFGQCGCCGGLSGEAQTVYAMVPFWMGYPGIGKEGINSLWSNPLANFSARHFPQRVYMTCTEVLTSPAGTARDITSFDIYGGITETVDPNYDDVRNFLGDFVGYDNPDPLTSSTLYTNGSWSVTLSNPWTYQQAVLLALDLLAKADLLNPDRAYIDDPNNPGNPIHFCYNSEAAAYKRSTNAILVTKPSGSLRYSLTSGFGGYTPPFGAGEFGWSGGAGAGAMKGFISSSNHNYGGEENVFCMDTFILVSKSAVRSPTGLTRRDDMIADLSSGTFKAGIPKPVNIPAGENIFLPSDLPDFGSSSWSSYPLTGL